MENESKRANRKQDLLMDICKHTCLSANNPGDITQTLLKLFNDFLVTI